MKADGWVEMMNAFPAPLLVFEDDQVIAANDAAGVELGRPAADLLDGQFVGALRPDSADDLRDALAQVRDSEVGSKALVVRRATSTPADQFFELRLAHLEGTTVTAGLHDVTEEFRLDAAVAALGDATVALDASGEMVWRPFGNADRFGITDDDALGARALEWMHPDELPHMLEVFMNLLAEPGGSRTVLIRMRHPYVKDRWLVSRMTAVNQLENPAMGAVVVRTENATEVDLEGDLTYTTGRFRSLAEATPVGIIVTDRDGAVLYRNELAREILGHELAGPVDWVGHLGRETAARVDEMLNEAQDKQSRGTVIVPFSPSGPSDRGAGAPAWLRVDAVPQIDEQGRSFGLIATLLDVTSETEARRQLAEAQDRLWHLATHDPLTGLANRVLFRERVGQALARRPGATREVAVLYCDLDGFKPVNDQHGHAIGDVVLRIVAERLSAAARADDLVCRFGGDEFLVLCEGFPDPADVQAVARRLIAAVEEPMRAGDHLLRVGMTVGIAFATEDARVDQLIHEADGSMYARKAARDEPSSTN